jgi:C4-dicarboxylate transporter
VKEIITRAYHEPAIFLGLLASVVMALITIISGDGWDITAIASVIAPLAAALGIREVVTPVLGEPADRSDHG